MHLSGQQLQQVSGVAAILRYPIPEIAEIDEVDEEEKEENGLDYVSSDEENDPLRRVKEDVAGMGL